MEPQSSAERPPIVPPIHSAVAGSGGDDYGDRNREVLDRLSRGLQQILSLRHAIPGSPPHEAIPETAAIKQAIEVSMAGVESSEAHAALITYKQIMQVRLHNLRDQLELERTVARPFRGDPILCRPEDEPFMWLEIEIANTERALASIRESLQQYEA